MSEGMQLAFMTVAAVLLWVVAIGLHERNERRRTERRLIRLATLGVIVGGLVYWNRHKTKPNTFPQQAPQSQDDHYTIRL